MIEGTTGRQLSFIIKTFYTSEPTYGQDGEPLREM